jgi:hypothetical protein
MVYRSFVHVIDMSYIMIWMLQVSYIMIWMLRVSYELTSVVTPAGPSDVERAAASPVQPEGSSPERSPQRPAQGNDAGKVTGLSQEFAEDGWLVPPWVEIMMSS